MAERDKYDEQAEGMVGHCPYCDTSHLRSRYGDESRCEVNLRETHNAVAAALRESYEKGLKDGQQKTNDSREV